MPENFSSVVHLKTQKSLGNSPVLLLLKNITATPNKHAWETEKPKNVEITANFGVRKLTLKSICATFSLVTPIFYLFLKSYSQVASIGYLAILVKYILAKKKCN